jgi:hypothetical protein
LLELIAKVDTGRAGRNFAFWLRRSLVTELRLCSSLDFLPEGKNPFGVTRADFSDSLGGTLFS